MILVTTRSQLDGYRITATKGSAQGARFEEMLRHAEQLGANAILNATYQRTIGADAMFVGDAVLVEPNVNKSSYRNT